MSKFVHSIVNSVTRYHIEYACDGVCTHVSIGKPAHLFGEQDVFGPVTRFLHCNACYARMRDASFVDDPDDDDYFDRSFARVMTVAGKNTSYEGE